MTRATLPKAARNTSSLLVVTVRPTTGEGLDHERREF